MHHATTTTAPSSPAVTHDSESFCCGEYWTYLGNGICSDQNTTQLIGSEGHSPLARATCTDPTFSSLQDLDEPCVQDPKIKTLELGEPVTTIDITALASASERTSSSRTTSKAQITQSLSTSISQTSRHAGAAAETTAAATSILSATPPSNGLSEGAKIGLGIGVTIGALLLIAAIFFFLFRRRRRSQQSPQKTQKITVELAATRGSQQAPEKGYHAPVSDSEGLNTRGELSTGEDQGRV